MSTETPDDQLATPGRRGSREPYPVATMLRAKELREAGWYPTDIRRILKREGHGSPSLFTIQIWTNPSYHERHQERMRSRNAGRVAEAASFRLHGSSEPYAQAFMELLRRDGVPCASIATVCRRVIDGFVLTDEQVRDRLRHVRPERASAVGVNSAPEHKSARRCVNTPGHGNEGVNFDAAAA